MAMLRYFVVAFALLASSALAQDTPFVLDVVADGLDRPLYVTAPAGDPRLFVVEQVGRIRIVADGAVRDEPFLDISADLSRGNEQGLLGLAFHPDYAANGRFFINYTDRAGATRIVSYRVSGDPDRADAASATPLLSIEQPFANHNGGWLGFGPDGLLYIGMGDGGAAGDPNGNGQNKDSLLGKILRIDVDGGEPYGIPAGNPFADGGGAPEIFALGLRNPWRISFDGDDIYIGDVGQRRIEEIDVIGVADAGANLGWNVMEGPDCYQPRKDCPAEGLVLPVHSYTHEEGCSVTGGYVYRGAAIPAIAGRYFFADYCAGVLQSFVYAGGAATEIVRHDAALGAIGDVTSFGLDGAGELYVTTGAGAVMKFAPR